MEPREARFVNVSFGAEIHPLLRIFIIRGQQVSRQDVIADLQKVHISNIGRTDSGSGFFHAQGGEIPLKFLIDRNELPYDAFVPDPSWLIPYEEEGDETDDEKTEEVQADEVHGEG